MGFIDRPNLSLKVQQPKSTFAEGNPRWTNKDLDPVPRNERKWGVTSFIAYWISDAFNASTWQFASSIIAVGFTWREALGIVALAFIIISSVIALNGAIGVIHHAPFPVLARASWGFWGSYIAIISRAVLGVFWFSIQTMNGANTVRCMLGAIWPSFLTMHNYLPDNAGIETNTMICFFIFWLAQVPFLCMHPNKLRWLFMAKSIITPAGWISIMVWAFVSTSGSGGAMWKQKTTLSGSAYSWAFLSSLTSVIGNYATLSVNQADFSRYSRISVKWQLMYVPVLPIIFVFIAFIGIASSSAGQVVYGELNWDPIALVEHFDNRAARFFAAFSFAMAALGANISANSLSAANDLTALFPQFINIRRGQLICAILCWALVPWKILQSAGSFLNFMSAYAVFLGPIASIMVLDFWILHRRRYDTLALYQPMGIYRYTRGVNWRAIAAFVAGVAPNMPGFINSINPKIEVGVGIHPYQFGWMLGFVGTGIVYLGLSYVWVPHETMIEQRILPDDVYDAMPGAGDEDSGRSGRTSPEGGLGLGELDEKSGGWKARLDRIL